jgi:hypothetical protein
MLMGSYPEANFLHAISLLIHLVAEAETVQYLNCARLKSICVAIRGLVGTRINQYGFDAIYSCPGRRHNPVLCQRLQHELNVVGPIYPAGPAPTIIKSTASDIVTGALHSQLLLCKTMATISLQRRVWNQDRLSIIKKTVIVVKAAKLLRRHFQEK